MPRIFDNIEQRLLEALQNTLNISAVLWGYLSQRERYRQERIPLDVRHPTCYAANKIVALHRARSLLHAIENRNRATELA